MDKDYVLNGNKLIADFMEWKPIACNSPKDNYYIPDGFELIIEEETTHESNWGWFLIQQDECSIKDMKFNTSWDWIMPVIYKIKWIENLDDEIYSEIDDALSNVLIEQVFEEVIEFIKWYNNEKS